jgi:hypothetical protein
MGDFLEKEYPKSEYRDEMQFLKANSYYRLNLEDKGRGPIQRPGRPIQPSTFSTASRRYGKR